MKILGFSIAGKRPPESPDVSANELASRILDRYDRNRDGQIQLSGNDGSEDVAQQSEAVVTTHSCRWDSGDFAKLFTNDNHGSIYSDGFSYDRAVLTTTTLSMKPLFVAADKDGDGVVSKQDLAAVIATCAAPGQGDDARLTRDQLNQLMADYPEVRITHTRELGHSWPKDGGAMTYEDVPPSDERIDASTAPDIYLMRR